MKRFLSITLCVMMLASLFAVNVSAAIPTQKDVTSTTPVALQTYEDTTANTFMTKPDYNMANRFTTFNEVTGDESSNKVTEISFSVKSAAAIEWETATDSKGEEYQKPTNLNATNSQLKEGNGGKNTLADGTTAVPAKYVYQFDVCAKDASSGLIVTRRGLTDNSVSVQQGTVIPGHTMIEGVWYTYRFVVDETGYRAATTANNARSEYKKTLKVYRAIRGTSDFTQQDTYYWKSGSYGNGNFGFQLHASDSGTLSEDVDATDITSYSYYNKADATSKTTVKIYNAALPTTYWIDNVGIYPYPEYADYDISEGFVYNYPTEGIIKTANSYAGIQSKSIGWETEPETIVATFDAVKDYGNGPLAFMVGGLTTEYGTAAIAPTADDVIYSYKVIFDNTFGKEPVPQAVYRSEVGKNNWTLLTQAPAMESAEDIEGYDWWKGYSSSNSIGYVNAMVYMNYPNAGIQNATENTKWHISNLQITDGNAFTGAATVSGGNLNLALNTELWSAADVIVAVYDGTKLANVSYAPVAITGNTATVTVPYTSGNKVLLYAWDALATGKPVLAEPITVNIAQ